MSDPMTDDDLDEIAVLAMQGLMANSECSMGRIEAAEYAYDIAEAMIAESKKRKDRTR